MVRLIIVLSCLFLLLSEVSAAPVQGRWTCVALGPSTLALTGDYTEVQQQLFLKQFAMRRSGRRRLAKWAVDSIFHLSGTEAIARYRPEIAALFLNQPQIKLFSRSSAPLTVVETGYWMNPVGQSMFPDEKGKMRFSHNADVAHYLYLKLSRPLAEGEQVTITLPAGETLDYIWRQNQPTPLFKINQVGYMPQARKYAYIGAWLGTAGPLRLHAEMDGKPFQLAEVSSGKTVFSGKLQARMTDPVNAKGTPFTGEEVLELDFSGFKTPGAYVLRVPGLGSSDPFRINDDTMAEAFFIHARGLFHQRCGIAKTAPYTWWTQKICHEHCFRGTFPPDLGHYYKDNSKSSRRDYGFFDSSGKSITVNHFNLIKKNAPKVPRMVNAPGGWHDAADWDRRPMHMCIVGELVSVYLLKPGNFSDGQLNLPESGNGIPDILDEARWGLEHLRRVQQPDGGVGTWLETIRHPHSGDGMASDDKLPYYVSCATRNSSLDYAAYASLLALAMRKAGAEKYMVQFRDSARRAWDYAMDPSHRCFQQYSWNKGMISYREKPDLSPELIIKAGFNLYQLTGDSNYLRRIEVSADAAMASMKRNAWRWSPFFWMELEIFPCDSPVLDKLRLARRNSVIAAANVMLRQQERNYPVRIAWYGPREGWVHTMGWGNFHPLVRARTLVAAHAMTGNPDYLEGALIANDFHNGANPFGSCMTSGLGRVYPVRFLDLNSYADGIAEPVPGITPYRNTYGIAFSAVTMAYGLFYNKMPQQNFPGMSISLFPQPGLGKKALTEAVDKLYPIWRRWCNIEAITVAASEFTVWDTMGPCAAVTGYLLNGASQPDRRWIDRRPADDIRKLPGYAPLP